MKIFEQIEKERFDFELDNQKFNQQCVEINHILSKEGYFLRGYELKKQFRQLRLKNPKQQKIVRQLLGCAHKNFDRFNIICVEYNKKFRKKFKPIDIIQKPVRKPERKIVTHPKICLKHIEGLVAKVKKYLTVLHLNVIIV